jgi:hypothetical protein
MVLLAGGALAAGACGGSSGSSAPATPPTPDTAVAIGTTLSVTSGETGQAVAGAHVVVSGKPYDTDSGGQITLVDRDPYGSLVDITAHGFLDRQTLLRKDGPRSFVLWPRTTAWGLDESYTAELVYTYASADPPAVGTSPLERIRQGTKEAVVVISDQIRQNDRANEAHQLAVGYINKALAGKLTYVLAPTTPATGVIFDVRVNSDDPVCTGRVLGYAQMSFQAGEITGGRLVYCGLDDVYTAVVAHELGHTAGLNHSPNPGDVMYQYITGAEQFSRNETLSLDMLYQRPAGNVFQDNDRSVSTSGSGTRTIVCY